MLLALPINTFEEVSSDKCLRVLRQLQGIVISIFISTLAIFLLHSHIHFIYIAAPGVIPRVRSNQGTPTGLSVGHVLG